MMGTVILNLRGKNKSLFDFIMVLFVSSLTFLVLLIGFASALAVFSNPAQIDARLIAHRTGSNSTSFEYIADFMVTTRVEAHISRELVHQITGQTMPLPYSERVYKAGEMQNHHQVFPIPEASMPGVWCMRYTVRWKPSWSLYERVDERTMACAELEPLMTVSK